MLLKKKVDRSTLGRRSRCKGANYERDVAKMFKSAYNVDLVRTPLSGGFAKKSEKADEYRGDISSADRDVKLKLHIECKNSKSWSLPSWIKQAESDCPEGRTPIVVFHQHKSSKDYVALSLTDFFRLVSLGKVIERVE